MRFGLVLVGWCLLSVPLGVAMGRFMRGYGPPHPSAPSAALSPTDRNEALRVLRLPDEERARRIGELYADEARRSLAERLIDIEVVAPAPALMAEISTMG